MSETTTEEDAQRWLRQTLLRFANGMTEAEADSMLDTIRRGWGIETFTNLATLVQVASPAALTPSAVLFWMDATLRMMAASNGCELVFMAGMKVARTCGVTAEVLDGLRERMMPPADEVGH